ncbi:nuclear transport factor 2 family protein [Aureivirga marina]|uniref:nuclear transport factor 2 family protein n=1 Tax=Aureivirga marina TaxID=1182451 RepID=UPI0018CBE3CF|nr:nuclear transport factor 2 family protein [Aureivirga marina]
MKKIFTILILSLSFISCDVATEKENNPLNKQNENLALIKEYFVHFNNHHWDTMANMYVESAEFKDPSFGIKTVKQTQKEIFEKYKELNQIFPDLNDKVIAMYPSGDKNIIVEFISTGTAPDGSKFELPICTIFTIENGKITKDYTYYDNFEEPNSEEEKS